MTAGNRFADWIGAQFLIWKAKILDWALLALGPIGNIFWNLFRDQLANKTKANLQPILDDPNTPEDIKALLREGINSVNPGGEVMAWFLTIVGTIISILHLGGPQGRNLTYFQDRKLKSFRLDPLSVITAWRRDPDKYDWLFGDLDDLGWTDERKEALKYITEYMPTPQSVIGWLAHEVFEPEMIRKYGLDAEFGALDLTIPRKIGMTDEMSLNEWRNHWEHASWNQVVEMLHRGLMTEEDVWEWFRLVEIPPYWRQKLIDSAYNVPTRVDVRRFYDMRTIDEARLREIYAAQGYHGKNLDDYVLWTKIYVLLPDLIARWKNGWITLDDVKTGLTAAGMDPAAADELIQTKVKVTEPTSTAAAKELTKTEIYKGVKQGIITESEGIELIMDLDYTEAQAEYLLTINVEVLTGSPHNFADFKIITDKYKLATGLGVKVMPEELKAAAAEVVSVTQEIESLQRAITEEKRGLIDQDILPAPATEHLTELEIALHRAQAELERMKQEYNSRVAEWRYREEK